jgi:hypothetical protein
MANKKENAYKASAGIEEEHGCPVREISFWIQINGIYLKNKNKISVR